MSELNGGGAETTASESTTESVDQQLDAIREAEGPETSTLPVEADRQEQREPEPAKTVPLAALHEARERVKEERRAREEVERASAQRFQMLEQRLQQLANPPAAPPDRQMDPVAYFDHRIAEVQSVAERTSEENNSLRQAMQARAQEEHMTTVVRASEATFVQEAPDFLDAINHMRAGVEREFLVYGDDPATAKAKAAHQFRQLAFQAVQQGKNPAEMAYRLAEARGYQRAASQADPATKLAAESRGVAASRTLGNGGQSAGKLTLESLAQMSDEDFSKVKDGDWRKAMGG